MFHEKCSDNYWGNAEFLNRAKSTKSDKAKQFDKNFYLVDSGGSLQTFTFKTKIN